MTWKLYTHTVLCALLVWLMWRHPCRERIHTLILWVAVWLGAAPFLYRLFRYPVLFPRMTIHGAQLALLLLVVVYFATRRKAP